MVGTLIIIIAAASELGRYRGAMRGDVADVAQRQSQAAGQGEGEGDQEE